MRRFSNGSLQRFHRICSRTRTVPYLSYSLKPEFLKTIQEKLKIKLFSDRARLNLSGYIYNSNVCQITFEKF